MYSPSNPGAPGGMYSPPSKHGQGRDSNIPQNHPQGNYQQGNYQQGNYPQGEYQQGGYQQGNYPQGNYSQGNYPPAYGMPRDGMIPREHNPPPNSGQWNAKLCGCGGNCLTCCIGCWCPCILIGQNIEIIDRGRTPCTTAGAIWGLITLLSGCGFVYSFMYRQRFREKYGLPSACPDILLECCCQQCSACQIDQELKSRNIDPSLGYDQVSHIYDQPYQGNAPRQQEMM